MLFAVQKEEVPFLRRESHTYYRVSRFWGLRIFCFSEKCIDAAKYDMVLYNTILRDDRIISALYCVLYIIYYIYMVFLLRATPISTTYHKSRRFVSIFQDCLRTVSRRGDRVTEAKMTFTTTSSHIQARKENPFYVVLCQSRKIIVWLLFGLAGVTVGTNWREKSIVGGSSFHMVP